MYTHTDNPKPLFEARIYAGSRLIEQRFAYCYEEAVCQGMSGCRYYKDLMPHEDVSWQLADH